MNRIEKRMEELQNKNEKAFVTYMTAGLPDMEGTKALIKAQAEAGIDIIELGIPFSRYFLTFLWKCAACPVTPIEDTQ